MEEKKALEDEWMEGMVIALSPSCPSSLLLLRGLLPALAPLLLELELDEALALAHALKLALEEEDADGAVTEEAKCACEGEGAPIIVPAGRGA